jgi:hypothetical protein
MVVSIRRIVIMLALVIVVTPVSMYFLYWVPTLLLGHRLASLFAKAGSSSEILRKLVLGAWLLCSALGSLALCRRLWLRGTRTPEVERGVIGAIVGAVVGGVLGFYLGVLVACTGSRAGNLCGLVGVFFTGPLGSVVGGVAGWFLRKSRAPAQQTVRHDAPR